MQVAYFLWLYLYNEQVMASNRASKEMMEQMKEDKLRLEQELDAVKSVASRRQADRVSEVNNTQFTICSLG